MVELDVHIQLGKKMIGWSGYVIIAFFGATKPLFTCENVWFEG